MNKYIFILIGLFSLNTISAKELFVSKNGSDHNSGTASSPFSSIRAAVGVALAGDTITVREGIYRELINPVKGGDSDSRRILYRAAPGEKVSVRGSEVITGWKKYAKNTWIVKLPNSFFGSYNSLSDSVQGDWFYKMERKHHTGELFLNGQSLFEVDSLEKVLNPKPFHLAIYKDKSLHTWFVETTPTHVVLYANFQGKDPNKDLVEVSVRPTCFYPSREGINYITIRGFEFCQAATQWAPPTAEQIGMIATHWNKGWIIEDNTIHDSRCAGITLGKERASGHNVWSANPKKDGSLHYIEVIFKVLNNHWDKDFIGSHVVRNNTIYNCEQAGICGSMGCAFSEVYGNHIYDIWVKRQFNGAEIAGIKFHGAIDTRIYQNNIHQAGRGLWLDWMTQGTGVSKNLFYDNDVQDLFVEVSHGPYLVDNNIFLSQKGVHVQSHGGAFVHNLFTGDIQLSNDRTRYTPIHFPHSTKIKEMLIIESGDDRFINNLFIPRFKSEEQRCRTAVYDIADNSALMEGNVFYNGAKPSKYDLNAAISMDSAFVNLILKDGDVYLDLNKAVLPAKHQTKFVTTQLLGKAKFAEEYYENPDGTSLIIDIDYTGQSRSINPTPGPFQDDKNGMIKVWSKIK